MFKDRADAAYQLVHFLQEYKQKSDAIIIAIPRGGLEIGAILAEKLNLPLDIELVKKIGYPGNPEYALGAVSLHHVLIDNPHDVAQLEPYIKKETARIRAELQLRYKLYKGDEKSQVLKDKIVIVTDDGVATGQTLQATLDIIRLQKPREIIVAIPVASEEGLGNIQERADKVICLLTPKYFRGVSQFYETFPQVSDETALYLLKKSKK